MALFQLCEHRDATVLIARSCWTDLEGKEAALSAGRIRFAIAMPGVMDIGGTLSNTSFVAEGTRKSLVHRIGRLGKRIAWHVETSRPAFSVRAD